LAAAVACHFAIPGGRKGVRKGAGRKGAGKKSGRKGVTGRRKRKKRCQEPRKEEEEKVSGTVFALFAEEEKVSGTNGTAACQART
jgi:hypothetical protein